DVGDVVPFADIVQPLVHLVEETVSTPELRLSVEVEGDVGDLPGELAAPLAVVLNELMQNAVDHAFSRADPPRRDGRLVLCLARDVDELVVEVVDDGVGLPPGFSLEQSSGLGLSIVHVLVTAELGGSIELRDNDPGTRVRLRVPLRQAEPVEL